MLYIIGAILLWSTLGLVIRFSGMPVELLIFCSCLISTVLIGAALLRRAIRGTLSGIRGSVPLLLVAPVSLANTFTFYFAYQATSVANAVLTHYTAPIFVALLAPLFLKEKATSRTAAAVVIATAGLWIMLGQSPESFIGLLTAGDRHTAGILAGLISGLAYGTLVIVLRKLANTHDVMFVTVVQNAGVSALLLPFISIPAGMISALWAFVLMGTVHSTIAPLMYLRGLRDVTAYTAAILGYLEPVCVIILGILFLHEPVTASTVAGGGMILLSGYLTLKTK